MKKPLIALVLSLLTSTALANPICSNLFGSPNASASEQIARLSSGGKMPKASYVKTKLGEREVNVLLRAANPNDAIISKNRRAFILLTPETIARAGISAESLNQVFGGNRQLEDFNFIGNFQHGIQNKKAFESIQVKDEGRFWIAVVPKDAKVNDVLALVDWFGDGSGGHAELRFQFDQPILLLPQTLALDKSANPNLLLNFDPQTVKDLRTEASLDQRLANQDSALIKGDLVYSLFGLPTENGSPKWGPEEGLTGQLVSSRTLSSTDHIASMQTGANFVEQVRLNTRSPQTGTDLANFMFEAALEIGSSRGHNDVYNLVLQSCINEIFKVMKTAGLNVEETVASPYRILPYLQENWLIKGYVKSLNAEYNAPFKSRVYPQQLKSLEPITSSAEFDKALNRVAIRIAKDAWSMGDLQYLKGLFAHIVSTQKKLTPADARDLQALSIYFQQNPIPSGLKPKLKNLLREIVSIQAQNSDQQWSLMNFISSTRVAP